MPYCSFDIARRICAQLGLVILILAFASSANADISTGLRGLLQGALGADLRVDSFALDKSQATVGETLRATVRVSNGGKSAAPSTTLTVWAQYGSSTSTPNAYRLATVRLGTLPPRASITSVSTFPVPNFGRFGEYQIVATVEASAPEQNRLNNSQAKTLMVAGPAVTDTDPQPVSDGGAGSTPPPPSSPVAGGGSTTTPPDAGSTSTPPASDPGSGSSSPPASDPGSGSTSPPPSSEPTPPPPAPSPPVASATCDFYASPSGRGSGTTPESPFRIQDFWAVAAPGKTLCLMNGTYHGSANMIDPQDGLAGTNGAPITIRAATDGAVVIDAQFVAERNPIKLGVGNHWFIIEGIDARNANNGNGVLDIALGASNNIVRRGVFYQPALQGSAFACSLRGSAQGGRNNVLEDAACIGGTRKALGTISSQGANHIVRRVYTRWTGAKSTSPKQTIQTTYNTSPTERTGGVILENVIATWTGEDGCDDGSGSCANFYGPTLGGALGEPDGTSRVSSTYGSLAYLKPGAAFTTGWQASQAAVGEDNEDGVLFQDVVSYVVGYSVRAVSITGTGWSNNIANNMIGIGGGLTSRVSSGWQGSKRFFGATLASVPSPYNGITDAQGKKGPLCFRYVKGLKTNTPLWPWPMDSRIKAALAREAKMPLAGDGTVTGEVESLLGPIPDECKQ
jgi:hypothetical protein